MAAMWRLLGAAPTQSAPLRVEEDDVYPLHLLDDTKTYRNIIVTWTLRFNDVLDAAKLHTSLSRLLEIGDWRKLGGRLRLKENGRLELHVPNPFTPERPAIFYTHQALDMDIENHPLAKTLPKATHNPSMHPGPQHFQEFAVREDAPSTLDDYIYRDIPQLSLHTTSFNDATLVGLSWPHTMMDAMGQHALLRGWCLVLAGQESEVPPMLGAREDALEAAISAPGEKEDEEYKLGLKQLKGWGMAKFGSRFAWDMVWNGATETRTIFLSKKMVDDLRNEAQSDLITQENGSGEKPFISDGDVLTAWAIRAMASSLSSLRPITALHALNARFRIPSISRSSGVYVLNMAVPAFTFLSPEVAKGPLGPIALENRRHLMEQSTETQVLAGLRREYKSGGNETFMCGEPDALLVPFTNWSRADFHKTIDFGPAVVRAGDTGQSRINPPGTIVFQHADSMRPNPSARNVVVILGKDHGGNYWVIGNLLPQTWVKIEEEINAYA